MQQIPFSLDYRLTENNKALLIKGEHNLPTLNYLTSHFLAENYSNENVTYQKNNTKLSPGKVNLAKDRVVLISGAAKVGKTVLVEYLLTKTPGIILDLNKFKDIVSVEWAISKHNLIIVEDIHQYQLHTATLLFHLYNHVVSENKKLILTSRKIAKQMFGVLPDLQSRILHILNLTISEPSESILIQIIFKMFYQKQIKVTEAIINYIITRVARNSETIYHLINRIEAFMMVTKQKLSLNLVAQVIASTLAEQDSCLLE